MRILFFGTPEFAIPSLHTLRTSEHKVVAVVTSTDKPQGRGRAVIPSPVKKYALENNVAVLQPSDLRDGNFLDEIRSLNPDLMVVVAFRILPSEVFTIPPKGTINLHASLLPRYRGAAPINWAIINGEKETGVTTFFIREKVDTGNIIMQERCTIGENETSGELHDKLAILGARVVLKTVDAIDAGTVKPQPQDESLVTKAPKLTKEIGHIDWSNSARQIHNFIRGLSPVPAAYTFYKNMLIKIYRSEVIEEEREQTPGLILNADKELHIATGKGTLKILELQREGKRILPADSFLRGTSINTGEVFK